jgi:uncharacterized protein involved in response to NO
VTIALDANPHAAEPRAGQPSQPAPLHRILGDEGFRLFFPLAALHLALWPVLWSFVHGLDLPFARTIPPGLWHAQEMLIGGFGAALIGFMTTAVPEWTDTQRPQHGKLYALAAVWLGARLVGLVGAEALTPLAALLDAIWIAALCGYALAVSWRKRTTRLLAFAGWIAALGAAALGLRFAFWVGEVGLAQTLIRIVTLVWCGLLGLALARITVPVTNLVLDPSERTSPFRPHPGRLNLAPGLAALALAGEALALSPAVSGFLWIAAGAAFLDRVAEAFVGREGLRAEILSIASASLLTGLGLMLVGMGRLGLPIMEATALHVAVMGGLGLGVLAVFCIAGLMHTGGTLPFGPAAKWALAVLVLGAGLRVAPDLGWLSLPGPTHGVASLVWAGAFLIWLKAYWPLIADASTLGARTC